MSTLKFYCGCFEDDFALKTFRTLVMQTRPVEFLCTHQAAEHTNIRGQETLKILNNSPSPPVKTIITFAQANDCKSLLQKYLAEDKWPADLKKALQ